MRPLRSAPAPLGLLIAALFVGGCGNHAPLVEDDTKATLSIDPPTSELVLQGGASAAEGFTATLTYPDGTSRDATSETTFTIDGSFGTFAGPQLTVGTNTGKTVVYGTWGGKQAQASLIVRLVNTRIDPGAPANAPALFGAATADNTRAPVIVYPPADVIVPRNLGDFEVHWTDLSTNDLYELSLRTAYATITVYTPKVPTGPGMWAAFLAAEWIGAVGTETAVSFQVRGLSQADPTKVGATPVTLVRLSNENVEGGIYYWASQSSSGLPEGIYRHDMAKPGQPAEQFMTKDQTSGRCVACHALSRDGKKMAITYDGGNGAATIVDVATQAAASSNGAWNFAAFSPDGAELITVESGVLTVRDTTTQAVLATATTPSASHPDVSPDGTQLVYVTPATVSADWHFGGGQLVIQGYDRAAHTFGTARTLVADGYNNYYPSFSPDGQWVLYNRSTDNSANGAYNNASATLAVVKADGSQPPVDLTIGNDSGALTNSWGRWAPFAQTYGAQQEPIFWITVSSKRQFGVRLPAGASPQIWMAPFFPARATAQHDPSAPMFRLPFQNLDSNNHIAQWTTHIVTQ